MGVAVQGHSVGLVNMGSVPLRAAAAEQALAEGAAPAADNNASAACRQHLARVLVRRALEEVSSR